MTPIVAGGICRVVEGHIVLDQVYRILKARNGLGICSEPSPLCAACDASGLVQALLLPRDLSQEYLSYLTCAGKASVCVKLQRFAHVPVEMEVSNDHIFKRAARCNKLISTQNASRFTFEDIVYVAIVHHITQLRVRYC